MLPRLTKYITHKPTAKQAAFLLLPQIEAFYGGAGGGGKSDALLMAALQYVDVPGYAALLLRRTYTNLSLPGALMDRAEEWLTGSDARWDNETHTWRFPSGATLTFGYLENEKDKYRYQSAEFQFVGFDEVAEFMLTQYLFLFSRLRRLAGVTVPLRMRSASNPIGQGVGWVKQRFLVEGQAAGRPFIPAQLEDNPHVDQAAYDQSLARLDPVTRARIRYGDWTLSDAGRMFKREWFPIVEQAPFVLKKVRFWDLAATLPKPGQDPDWTCGALLGEAEGRYWLLDMRRARTTPGGVEALVRQTAQLDGREVSIYIEQEGGASGKSLIDHYQREVLIGFACDGAPASGDKVVRANPLASAAQAGNVLLLQGTWISAFLDEIELFPDGQHDDQVDAVSGALGVLAGEKQGQAFAYQYTAEKKPPQDIRGRIWPMTRR